MKTTTREVKARQAALRASGHSKADVQRLARVAERTVYYWYRGEKSSPRVAAAHRALTAGVLVALGQADGNRTAEAARRTPVSA